MTEKHEPDPRFVEGLAGELGRELRRQNRAFGRAGRGLRALKTTGLIMASVAVGAVAMGATQQIGDSWRKELVEARLEVQLRLAREVVQTQQESWGLVRSQVERGVRESGEIAYADYQIAEAEAQVRIAELELEESRLTGREPQDALSSPLVDGRDFVSDRIRARMEVARRHLELARQVGERARQRAAVGIVQESESEEQQLVAREAELELASLTRELELRRDWLGARISPVEAELRLLEAQAGNRVAALELRVRYLRGHLQRFQAAIGAGTMRPAVAVELQTQVAEAEAKLELAQAELRIVREELARR
ncbi:MAG: hypothetical protein PVH00_02675 [Gemmatimonadota bacterium]|jgi:hypothetical protein